MTTMQTSALPTADELRDRVRAALLAIGAHGELGQPGEAGVPASTPITGDVLFTVAETTAAQTDEAISAAIEAGKTDWRPLISYTANLQRIEEHLLGTNAARVRLSQLAPEGSRSRLLSWTLGTQYPWYWSAIVLVGLLVLSVGILNRSVRSLDQLK